MAENKPTEGRITLRGDVRLAFPTIWKPEAVNDGEPAYSCSLLLPRDHPQISKLNALIDKVAKEKWKEKAPAIVKTLRAQDRVCLHDGDNKSEYAGFPGNWYITTRNKARPTIVDRDRTPLTQADGRPYGGCYVVAIIGLWAQDHAKFGKRINASLEGLQFEKHGDAFSGGRVASTDDFEDLGFDDEETEEEEI